MITINKRYISIILVLAILATLFIGCAAHQNPMPDNSPSPEPVLDDAHLLGDENKVLTVCAMSDIHMGDKNTEESFNKAMDFMTRTKAAPDAYVFSGDLTNTTAVTLSNEQVVKFKNIYEQYAEPSQMVYCLGPAHDVPNTKSTEAAQQVFTDTFGAEYYSGCLETEQVRVEGIRWVKIKGFNFYSLDWNSNHGTGAPSSAALRWLRETLTAETEIDSEKPIFVAVHVPDIGTITSVLKRFPQVICFTGHLHNSVAREDSISQDKKFTNIHCGGQNYYRVNGYERFTEDPFLDLGDIYAFGQAIYLQVDQSNNVTITRVDTYNGKIIGEKWEIGPGRRSVYTKDRIDEAEKCLFEEDDVLRIRELDGKSLAVSFDGCKAGSAGPVLYYQIKLYAPTASGIYKQVDHKEISSQQVFYPNDVGIPLLHYSYTFNDLDCLDNYAVVVTAKDCWGESGNALIYTNGTYEYKIPAAGKVDFAVGN